MVRRRVELWAAHGARFSTFFASGDWHYRYKRWQMSVNRTEESVVIGHITWRQFGGRWTGPLLCNWGNRRRWIYYRICKKVVSLLLHGKNKILRHLQGSKKFPATSVFDWRIQASAFSIGRETTWRARIQNGSDSRLRELHWLPETGNTCLLRTFFR